MKISVSTLGLYPASTKNVLDFLTDLKIKYVEIIKEYPYHNINKEDFESYEITPSIHAPMSDINIASHVDKIRETSVQEMKDAFKTANDIGANRVVVHPGTIPVMALKYPEKILKLNTDSLLECKKAADDYGVMMCVENMPLFERMLYTNVDALFKLIDEEIHSGITLDVGHANNNGFTVEEMLNSKDIHHIHLSDNDGSYDQHHALGENDIDFIKIFEILKQRKYDDICVIEVNSKHAVLRSIDYLKENKLI